ncbi:hypothetical protein EIP91_000369 [Steccherinum ochraceum]|uniref:Uncharacterized protein n=1 Tax=Steccherinum ochraceum TaxID=92696 RepID=A0A4R0RFW3_9APHY|nr:hypothetical protein EIP91_000369 [Steccherinum ochraceum]
MSDEAIRAERKAFHDRTTRIIRDAKAIFTNNPQSYGFVYLARAETITTTANSPKAAVSQALEALGSVVVPLLTTLASGHRADSSAQLHLDNDTRKCQQDIIDLFAMMPTNP